MPEKREAPHEDPYKAAEGVKGDLGLLDPDHAEKDRLKALHGHFPSKAKKKHPPLVHRPDPPKK